MVIEYLSYIAAFIISSGISALGILITYQIYQQVKKTELSSLLYQQIFLYSFFIYGIWGKIALHEIMADLNLSEVVSNNLEFFVPVIGLPFLIVSWFMLLKFAFNLNGYSFSTGVVIGYFVLFVALIFLLILFIRNGLLVVPDNSNVFIVRIFVAFNLLIHVVFLLSFLKPRSYSRLKELKLDKNLMVVYLPGVLGYSAMLFFFDLFGFISTCLTIIILFAVSALLPLKIKFSSLTSETEIKTSNFSTFCELYEISKREAEIIREICSGKTNKDIAEKLFITLQTVKDHNHRIFTKTGVKSRVQLSNLVREKTEN